MRINFNEAPKWTCLSFTNSHTQMCNDLKYDLVLLLPLQFLHVVPYINKFFCVMVHTESPVSVVNLSVYNFVCLCSICLFSWFLNCVLPLDSSSLFKFAHTCDITSQVLCRINEKFIYEDLMWHTVPVYVLLLFRHVTSLMVREILRSRSLSWFFSTPSPPPSQDKFYVKAFANS